MSDQLVHLNDDNFEKEISDGVALVDFYADWCGPCRMMEPIIHELAVEMEGKAKIAKLDIEAAQKVTANFDVTSIPTIIIFKNGKEVQRIVGVKDKAALLAMLQKTL